MVEATPERTALCGELQQEVVTARRSGRTNYCLSYALKLASLIASVTAGALGIVFHASPAVVGLIALIPGAAALIGQEMKFQQKAHYFYRMACDLDLIRSRAAYSDTAADTVAALAAEAARIRQSMGQEWERSLGFGWHNADRGAD